MAIVLTKTGYDRDGHATPYVDFLNTISSPGNPEIEQSKQT